MDQWRRSGLRVRDADIRDLDPIADLERLSFPDDQVSRRSFAYHLRAPERPVIAAEIDGELAGYVLLALRKGGRWARIFSIAVEPRFCRRGVGETLLAAAEKFARRHEREAITLEVRYDNKPAIALYQKCGFRPFGKHKEYYADGATALRYRKALARSPAGPALAGEAPGKNLKPPRA